MRFAVFSLSVLVGILSVAVAILWLERDHGSAATSSGIQAPVLDVDPSTAVSARDPLPTNSDVDRRFGEVAKRLDDLTTEVEQLKTSTGRSPLPAPPLTEDEFMDRHRASVVQIMDDVQRKREWEQAVESAQAIAGGFSSHCKQPDSAKPAFREFGAEYMRRAGAILDEARSHWIEVKKDGTPEQDRWVRQWEDLYAWAQGRLGEIDGAHAQENWNEFRNAESGLSYHFMPH